MRAMDNIDREVYEVPKHSLSGTGFTLSSTRRGDLVQLRFTGDKGVPNRLGNHWASVHGADLWRRQWRKTPPCRVGVEPFAEPDTERRITLDQIQNVERDGVIIAKRIQNDRGTWLVHV